MPGTATEVLGAMITPAVLISASGTLVLSTSNRLTRVVDRVRSLTAEVERARAVTGTPLADEKAALVASQLHQLARRVLLLRSAMTALYSAIGLLIATSIAVGLVSLVDFSSEWFVVAVGIAGAAALLWGSLLLVREARLAVVSTLEEMQYARDIVQTMTRDARAALRLRGKANE